MLSLISVLGVFVILGVGTVSLAHLNVLSLPLGFLHQLHPSTSQVSLIRSGRDKTGFVHTQLAKFLSSLLLCNLTQAIGGLLNIAWLIENRVYIGVTCTTQAALKQIGNVRAPLILSRRVTTHTSHGIRLVQRFSLLSSPPKPFAYSFFVRSGRTAHAISSISLRGLSSYSNCASKIMPSPTWKEGHIMESLPLATGAGSRPST